MYSEIHHCRLCGNAHLTSLLDLGAQALSGVFPGSPDQDVPVVPMEIVKCAGDGACGLVQLRQTADLSAMYGMNYGYRSGLNAGMVTHLKGIVEQALSLAQPKKGDLILDIGSNDGTLLGFYGDTGFDLLGIDPTGVKFKQYYPSHVRLVPDFFTGENFRKAAGGRKAKIITSIAMLYDLEDPQHFVDDIAGALADDGVWIFEQSYLPSMLQATSYDTICQEHLEYYAMKQIAWMLEHAGMAAIDVTLTAANGGSFRVAAAKKTHPAATQKCPAAEELLLSEEREGIDGFPVYERFAQRVSRHRESLRSFLRTLHAEGKTVFGLGASTKGNVLLQYCGLTPEDLPCIAEVNEDKFGKFTPGNLIPIVSEEEADARQPDYYLVLPWHFREGITKGRKKYLEDGGKLIFPLPELQVVSREGVLPVL